MESIRKFIKIFNKETIIDLIIAMAIVIGFSILGSLIAYLIIKIFNIKKKKNEIKNNTFYAPLKVFFRLTGVYLAILFLRPTFEFTDKFMLLATRIYKIIIIISMASSFANSITKKSKFIQKIKENSEKNLSDTSLKILVRTIKVLIYIVAAFLIFAELGYDLSGLITGLGLGSVVLTIAAQDTIKNLLGGIVIFVDKPFKLGDYVKISDYEGTVEDITFRSTKLRTIEDSIIQIPNSVVSADAIENLSAIKTRRYKFSLGVILNTSMEKIEALKRQIITMLENNEIVVKDKTVVYFDEIGNNSYNIIVICYFNTGDYTEFLGLKDVVNENIINILNKNGVELAYDTKTIEVKNT